MAVALEAARGWCRRSGARAGAARPPGILPTMGTVAIFGAGVMGETLLSGLLRSGRPADELVITERREDRAAELTERYGVRVLDNADAAELADTLVLVVKPQDM